MSTRFASVSTKTILAAGVGNNVEVVVFTTGGLQLPADNAIVLIYWEVVIGLGAAQTGLIADLRRGTLATSPLINVAQGLTTVAATNIRYSGAYFDSPGVSAGLQYSLCINCNGAAAAGTVVDGSLTAIAL